MAVPSTYALRAPRPGDFPGVAAVLAADDLDDAGEVVLDEGFLRWQWERPGFVLGTDAWVAVDEHATVAAYGQLTRDDPDVVGSWAVVHPAHRGRGLSAALVDRIEKRAPALAPGPAPLRVRNAINAGDGAAAALLGSRGYHLVRHFWHMRIDVPDGFDPGDPPAGLSITALRSPEDLPAVHRVIDVAFADHWAHQPEPLEDWAEDNTGGASYDPQLWRLAWDGERLVGALTAAALEGRGWVELLGVVRSARGRGIAAALLRQAFAAFAERGARAVYLAVDAESPTGATALYEREGMHVVKRWDLWEKPLG
jgi:mycothiol synthase